MRSILRVFLSVIESNALADEREESRTKEFLSKLFLFSTQNPKNQSTLVGCKFALNKNSY